MSGRPVVAHVLNSIGLGGVPEVAWQLMRRLPDDRFAITDFDGARIGDPHRDLAIWLAALTFDLPALDRAVAAGDEAVIARAEAAYLEGYGAHDERRLLWHRAAAEVHYVAVALKKDRHEPPRARRGLRIARRCTEALA